MSPVVIISTINGSSMKLVDKFTNLGSRVSTNKTDIDTRLGKARTAIDNLSVIWKSDLTDKSKRSFFQSAVVSILLYGCPTWTLTKHLEKKFDGNYTRMLRAILNKSWRQHPTKQQLYFFYFILLYKQRCLASTYHYLHLCFSFKIKQK